MEKIIGYVAGTIILAILLLVIYCCIKISGRK